MWLWRRPCCRTKRNGSTESLASSTMFGIRREYVDRRCVAAGTSHMLVCAVTFLWCMVAARVPSHACLSTGCVCSFAPSRAPRHRCFSLGWRRRPARPIDWSGYCCPGEVWGGHSASPNLSMNRDEIVMLYQAGLLQCTISAMRMSVRLLAQASARCARLELGWLRTSGSFYLCCCFVSRFCFPCR